jgi:D-3-phosphoglycerate dehydrogenase
MKIFIPDDYHGVVSQLKCLKKLAQHEVHILKEVAPAESRLASLLKEAEVIVPIRERTEFSRSLLSLLPHLKFMAQTGRSAHSIDLQACDALGIAVCSGSHASPYTVAEHTWALIFAFARQVAEDAQGMKQGRWKPTFSTSLRGKTLGILGLGTIGEPVAATGASLGMRVITYGRQRTADRTRTLGYEMAASREALFAESDVLSINLRLNESTRGCITTKELSLMKPSALIVNTARAELIAEGALVEALRQGRPGFAATDVYENEPVQHGNHPLLSLPNALCTPHSAWLEASTYELYFGEAFDQVLDFAAGKPLKLLNHPAKRPE